MSKLGSTTGVLREVFYHGLGRVSIKREHGWVSRDRSCNSRRETNRAGCVMGTPPALSLRRS